jgi:hypothetical protein
MEKLQRYCWISKDVIILQVGVCHVVTQKVCQVKLSNYMEQNPSWEADGRPATEKNSYVLWDLYSQEPTLLWVPNICNFKLLPLYE